MHRRSIIRIRPWYRDCCILLQEEDQELFADEQIKAIYAETLERMEEKQTVQAYYGNSWKNWSEMFQALAQIAVFLEL